MLSVTLENRDGVGVGTLEGHPAGVEVRTKRGADGSGGFLTVSLWDHGTQIGSGRLDRHGKMWSGTCSEFAGRWFVSGAVGSGKLLFAEAAE